MEKFWRKSKFWSKLCGPFLGGQPLKRWLVFITRFLLFSCLLGALWHIDTAMWFYETEITFVRFFSFYLYFSFYNSLCISSYVTQGVRRAPIKTSLHAIVSIFRAETSVLANEVTVLSWSVTVFFFKLWHTKIDFWRINLGVIFTFKTTTAEGVSNKGLKLYHRRYFA